MDKSDKILKIQRQADNLNIDLKYIDYLFFDEEEEIKKLEIRKAFSFMAELKIIGFSVDFFITLEEDLASLLLLLYKGKDRKSIESLLGVSSPQIQDMKKDILLRMKHFDAEILPVEKQYVFDLLSAL